MKAYAILLSTGEYDSCRELITTVFKSKGKALRYLNRYNALLSKLKHHYDRQHDKWGDNYAEDADGNEIDVMMQHHRISDSHNATIQELNYYE